MQKLSFLQPHYQQLLELLPELVKGLQKASCIYEKDETTFRLTINNGVMQEVEVLEGQDLLDRLLSFSTTKKQFIWLSEEDLPFDKKSSSVLQLQLSQETERSVLVFYIEKPDTHRKDLVLLYFNEDSNYFGLRKKASLSTQEKSILAQILWNTINTLKKQHSKDYQLYREILDHKKGGESEAKAIRSQLEKEQSARGESLTEYTDIVLDKWRTDLSIDIRLTSRAYKKIQKEAKSFKQLELSLQKSIRVATNTNFSDAKILLLDDFEITLSEVALSADKQIDKPLLGRLEATKNLLDKYEISARKVTESGNRVLGKTVGQYCQPPISNAAITDAVKNHKERIIRLLETYPDYWPIIRHDFKTITNLLLPEKTIEKKSA
jgi:hypothetical protein